MNYTVIQKSGWAGAGWKVAQTFTSRAEADKFAQSKEQPNMREDFYRVSVKAHRNSLSKLVDKRHGDAVQFSDGTIAVW